MHVNEQFGRFTASGNNVSFKLDKLYQSPWLFEDFAAEFNWYVDSANQRFLLSTNNLQASDPRLGTLQADLYLNSYSAQASMN